MGDLEKNKDLILRAERAFAARLAHSLISEPKLSVWMILIPVIFVFFFYQRSRAVSGRKDFVANYMIGVERALNAVLEARASGRTPNYEELASLPEIPSSTWGAHAKLVRTMAEFYEKLLAAQGDDYPTLARSAYENRALYLQALEDRNRAEQDYNAAIRKHVGEKVKNDEDLEKTIRNMERLTRELREQAAAEVFA